MSAGGKKIILAFSIVCITDQRIEPLFRIFLNNLRSLTTVKLFVLSTGGKVVQMNERRINEMRKYEESHLRYYFYKPLNTLLYALNPDASVLYTKKTIDDIYYSIPGVRVREPAYFVDISEENVNTMAASGIPSFYIDLDSAENDLKLALDSIVRPVQPSPLRLQLPNNQRKNSQLIPPQSPFVLPPQSPFVLPPEPQSPFILSPSTPLIKGGRRTRRTNLRKSRKHRAKK